MDKLCGETVTLYHPDAAHRRVMRRVVRGVYWQQGRRALPDAGGTRQGTALLVVIPQTAARYGADYTLAPGDRLCLGEGPVLQWEDRAQAQDPHHRDHRRRVLCRRAVERGQGRAGKV